MEQCQWRPPKSRSRSTFTDSFRILIVANSARGDLLNPTQIAHEIRGKIPGISMSATELADTVTKMADGMPRGLPECRDWS